MEKAMKLNNTIESKEKKLNNTIKSQEKKPTLGDLVTHINHPLGLGLIVEKHPKHKAYRVEWIEHNNLTLFIDQNVLCPINKEHAHESDDL